MKIRHERPMSDLDFKVRAPLTLELTTGERITISNWSLSGVQYPQSVGVFPKKATLSIPFQGVDIRFPVDLIEEADGFLRFDQLTGRQRETLAIFYRSILSGKMASTEDIITSLDCPVDLVPMGETEEEIAIASDGKSPRSLRAMFAVLTYLMLAIVVFWTLGAGIYGSLATVAVQNARAEAPFIPAIASDSAYVKSVNVAVGDAVKRGDILVRMTTPDGEAALSEVRGRIDFLTQRLDRSLQRKAAAEMRLAQAREAYLRPWRLVPDETGQEFLAAYAAFETKAVFKEMQSVFLASLREIELIEDELRRLRRDRGRLRGTQDALHIRAFADGVVTDISVLKGQLVNRGFNVITIEENAKRTVRGWLDQSMTAAVHVGMQIEVRVNSAGGTRKVLGEISELNAGIDPELSSEFGMLVTVDFPELSVTESRQMFSPMMPVEVSARRGWAVKIAQKAQSIFNF